MRIEDIKISLIDVPAGRRVVRPDTAQALAEDMKVSGQREPIEVVEADGRFRLVFGAHRLSARKLNGDALITARVKLPAEYAGEAAIKLSEIAENFMRRELSVLDKAFDVASWREIYEAATGAIKRGRKAISPKLGTNSDEELSEISEQFAGSFSEAARRALSLTRNEIFRSLKIASISQDVRERISLHPIADNQSELLALAAEAEARHELIVALLTSEPAKATSVAQAIGIIDQVPAATKAEAWEKLSGKFTKLGEAQQRRFLIENWAVVEQLYVELLATKKAA